MAEFRYYMLRVRREPEGTAGPKALGGVLERLGSGEKHGFANAQELLHLLGTWAESASNMSPVAPPRNEAGNKEQ